MSKKKKLKRFVLNVHDLRFKSFNNYIPANNNSTFISSSYITLNCIINELKYLKK